MAPAHRSVRDGYCSDFGRTAVCSDPPAELRRIRIEDVIVVEEDGGRKLGRYADGLPAG